MQAKIIPREIHFIWFGSQVPGNPIVVENEDFSKNPLAQALLKMGIKDDQIPILLAQFRKLTISQSEDFWNNILLAKKTNPMYRINLYIYSEVISESDFRQIQQNCREENIVLIDIANHLEMKQWFNYDLLCEVIKKGKRDNIKAYYAKASDILRILLMIYKGGYYFDGDCTKFPELAKTEHIEPPFGFWQCPGEAICSSPWPMPYCFQASMPFNPFYVLASAEIAYMYKNCRVAILDCEINDNPLLSLLSFEVIAMMTGQALYHALLMKAFLEKKEWKYFVNESNHSVIFPDFKSIEHAEHKSYLDENDARLTVNNNIKEKNLEQITKYFCECKNMSLELYHLWHDSLPDNLKIYLRDMNFNSVSPVSFDKVFVNVAKENAGFSSQSQVEKGSSNPVGLQNTQVFTLKSDGHMKPF